MTTDVGGGGGGVGLLSSSSSDRPTVDAMGDDAGVDAAAATASAAAVVTAARIDNDAKLLHPRPTPFTADAGAAAAAATHTRGHQSDDVTPSKPVSVSDTATTTMESGGGGGRRHAVPGKKGVGAKVTTEEGTLFAFFPNCPGTSNRTRAGERWWRRRRRERDSRLQRSPPLPDCLPIVYPVTLSPPPQQQQQQ